MNPIQQRDYSQYATGSNARPPAVPAANQDVANLISELREMSGTEEHFEIRVRPQDTKRTPQVKVGGEDMFDRSRRLFFGLQS